MLHSWSDFTYVYLAVNVTDPIFGLLSLVVMWVWVIVLLVLFGPKRLSLWRENPHLAAANDYTGLRKVRDMEIGA